MQSTLEDFLRALRAVDLRISPAESIDAHRAAAAVGYGDREMFRDALCVTLAKSADDVDRFETCFDTFFRRSEFTGAMPEDGRHEDDPADEPAPDGSASLTQMLLQGDAAGLALAMEASAARARAGEIQLNAQRSLITRRILDGMGLREVEARIGQLRDSADAGDAALAERLAEQRRALFVEAGRFVERQARLHTAETARRLRESLLAQQALTAVEPHDFRAMEALVRRMARRLASKYARKVRHARRGRLDVRKTVARAMPHGGIPFEVVWKSQTVHKPKIAVLCDVSRSVAAAAQFLLLFLYSLNEVVERLDAYAFSDRAVCVNDLLKDETVDDAITLIIDRIGFRPTDYGVALADFEDLQGAGLDRRTTVIVLGDGRSNFADPRFDLMRRINEQSRAVIWLNPEPETYWGQGDSRMDAYQRFCTVAKTCNTLNQLERIIEDVLRTYLPR
jgi:uncharacterized protein with von Willebrand factor type A (vWA) domain